MVWLTTSMLAISGAYRKSKQMPLKYITLFPKRYFHSLIKKCENLYIYDRGMNIWNIASRHVWQLKLFKFCFLMETWNLASFRFHWLNFHTDYNASIYGEKVQEWKLIIQILMSDLVEMNQYCTMSCSKQVWFSCKKCVVAF